VHHIGAILGVVLAGPVDGRSRLLLVGHPRRKGKKAHNRHLWSSPHGSLPLEDSTHGKRLEAHGGHASGLRRRRDNMQSGGGWWRKMV
jgi:hypothetical protein